jgi:hypothetical protein
MGRRVTLRPQGGDERMATQKIKLTAFSHGAG